MDDNTVYTVKLPELIFQSYTLQNGSKITQIDDCAIDNNSMMYVRNLKTNVSYLTRLPFNRRCTIRVTHDHKIINNRQKIDFLLLTLILGDLDLQRSLIFSAGFPGIQAYWSIGQVKYDILFIWPWPSDLDTRTWSGYGHDVSVNCQWSPYSGSMVTALIDRSDWNYYLLVHTNGKTSSIVWTKLLFMVEFVSHVTIQTWLPVTLLRGSSFQKDLEIQEIFVENKMSSLPILISIHPLTLASRDLFLLAKMTLSSIWGCSTVSGLRIVTRSETRSICAKFFRFDVSSITTSHLYRGPIWSAVCAWKDAFEVIIIWFVS